jgi:hypothetical protein
MKTKDSKKPMKDLGSIEINIILYYLIIYHKSDGFRDEAKPALNPTLLYTTPPPPKVR